MSWEPRLPEEIEAESFTAASRPRRGSMNFRRRFWSVVRRMIHTSADLDYLESVRLHPGPWPQGWRPCAREPRWPPIPACCWRGSPAAA